jgi:diguanylate cyclase (GGDEF)-like protein
VISPLPGVSPSPSTLPPNQSSGSGTSGGTTSGGGPAGGHDPHGILTIPFTTIVLNSPFDVALAGALAVLPLLVGLWLLLFGRTWVEARRAKDARLRLMLAGELGIGPRELSSLSLQSLYKLREEAAFDELTGVMRRAAGMSALEREIARARRQKTALTVAFLDVDGLKQANDTRGHKAGDELLKGMANALRGGLRGQDLVLRYGGDEFVCVLPDTVYDAGRAKLSWVQTDAARAGIRFSVGLAQLERTDDVVSLLGRADRELYDAKAHKHADPMVVPAPDKQGRRQVSA